MQVKIARGKKSKSLLCKVIRKEEGIIEKLPKYELELAVRYSWELIVKIYGTQSSQDWSLRNL